MDLGEILAKAVAAGASDIHIKHGVMPVIRVNGKLFPIDKNAPRLTHEDITKLANSIMTPAHKERFAELHEVDMGYGVPGLGRFRVNIFQQRGTMSMAIRTILSNVKSLEDLNLPTIVSQITSYERGLILVTGTTGSGKTTTLASMVDFINTTRTTHILTIEDPIEYLIRDKRSIVTQRELGLDTPGYAFALKQGLRQDPDVILIGEMRDKETIKTALLAAETGHLVFSTLHTSDAKETVTRILAAFEADEQAQIRVQLASNLSAVISQRLLPRMDGKGLVPACEIMIVNTRIREMIMNQQRTLDIPLAIEEGVHSFGMQTFDQSLMELYKKKLISLDEAKAASSNPDDFLLRVKGITSLEGRKWHGFDSTATNVGITSEIPTLELATRPMIKDERVAHDEEPSEEPVKKKKHK